MAEGAVLTERIERDKYKYFLMFFLMQQMACRYSPGTRGATMTGVVTISSGDEHSLQSAVANVGPVSTYIDASHSSFQVIAPLGNRVYEGGST